MQKKPTIGPWGIALTDTKTQKTRSHKMKVDNDGMGYCEWCKSYGLQEECENCGRNTCKGCAVKCPKCKRYYCPVCSSPDDNDEKTCYECRQAKTL